MLNKLNATLMAPHDPVWIRLQALTATHVEASAIDESDQGMLLEMLGIDERIVARL